MPSNSNAANAQGIRCKKRASSKLVATPTIPIVPQSAAGEPVQHPSPRIVRTPISAPQNPDPGKRPTEHHMTTRYNKNAVVEASRTSPERVDWEYNVYAAPFVPSQLRTINLEIPGRVVRTRSQHRVDDMAYITAFTGTSFLPARPISFQEVEHKGMHGGCLTAQSYFHHFTALWEIEYAAKEQENEESALYKISLDGVQEPNRKPLWTLIVPGLRDDNPFLERGDVLQLRQLWVDINKDVVQMPMQVEDPGYGHVRLDYKRWTGIQYDSCIVGVNRKEEIVYMEAEGLAPLWQGNAMFPMVVNVCFPMKHTSLERQRMALVYISLELKKMLRSELPVDDDDDFDDFISSLKPKPAITEPEKPQEPCNNWILRILFPTQEHGIIQTRLRKVPHRKLFDSAVNYEQAHAVNSICINDYGTLPYLISGPPGTGKTKTLVETAMNMLQTTDVAHILICAPSEAAADTLALRLRHYLNDKQLLRLNRPERADNEVPGELLPYCHMENDMFYLPPFRNLMAYNVIVTSCRDAALLADVRLTNNDLWEIEKNMIAAFRPEEQEPMPHLHWGALLIDEAAQATEIDVLPAISVVCPPSAYPATLPLPRFVMAGDENQLGPRTSSRDAQFSTSLFARLFDRPLYKNHPLSRTNIKPSTGPPVLKKSMLPMPHPPFANLIRNYRSHPAILSVPSSLFYNDTLIPEAPTPCTPLQNSTLWRGRKWPVLFLPNTANDEIERDGGGWYNVSEARLACSIANTLVYDSSVEQADICIMSPFAAQVKLLRSLIRSSAYGGGSGLWDVNIGPLEAFQGLEKRVIIICTTRTRSRFLAMDEKKGMGIVNQKRKMNVALTRAMEALFVIGSPDVLGRDEHWRQWLAFCWRNGLVLDPAKVWEGDKEVFGEKKVGVLERALVAKEENGTGKGRTLGAGVESLDLNADYETWVESLREALDEEEEEDDDEEEEDLDSATKE